MSQKHFQLVRLTPNPNFDPETFVVELEKRRAIDRMDNRRRAGSFLV